MKGRTWWVHVLGALNEPECWVLVNDNGRALAIVTKDQDLYFAKVGTEGLRGAYKTENAAMAACVRRLKQKLEAKLP